MMAKLKQAWGIAICVGVFGCGSDDTGADTEDASATETPTTDGTDPTGTGSGSGPASATSSTSTTGAPTSATTGSTSDPGTTIDPTNASSTGDETTGGVGPNTDFEEIDGIVVFEAEHYTEQTNTEPNRLRWYEISSASGDIPDDQIDGCVVDTPCTADNTPLCNLYSECDGDGLGGEGNALTDPADASNETYLEVLPDRRRADSADEEPSGGFSNTPGAVAVLSYRVFFNQTGRYYGYCRARGRGPAANGLHLGIDGQWPSNELGDNSGMRWQFPNGWRFVNHRRGQNQHTGGVDIEGVSQQDANIWFEVDEPGWHDVQVSMREDGVEIDKFMFVLDAADAPGEDDLGPAETLYER
ncbi:MAG: hypothetical protein ACRBN8_38745 [Nannocystales bacterium]